MASNLTSNFDIYRPEAASYGVIVLCHGLNLHPGKMRPLAHHFVECGYTVFNVKLTGYHDFEAFRSVTSNDWRADIDVAIEAAFRESSRVGYVGFSMGAMIGLDHIRRKGSEFFYYGALCPAIALRIWTQAVRGLFPLKRFLVPSASDAEYRRSSFTPVAAYKAFLDIYDEFYESYGDWKSFPLPKQGRVIVADGDELVDSPSVATIFRNETFVKYPVSTIPKRRMGKQTRINHLALDELTLGPEQWGRMKSQFEVDFLSNKQS